MPPSPWFTPRRCLVYSAYFVGVFSLCIGIFISKQVWTIHTTIRLIEKSWDARGHDDYRNATWLGKAAHALLAGHEDMSEYNDLFWAKFAELETQGSFNRSNLTGCEAGYAPEWADQNNGYDKWGFVLYRTDYDENDEEWAETVRHMNYTIRSHLEIDATHKGSECDPDLVRDRAVLEIIEDRETLDGAQPDTIRALWRERVDSGLVESSLKMGGWNHGWFRMNLCKGGDGGESNEKLCKKPNGMALNLCLMYDMSARLMMGLTQSGLPATGPRDPWEPFLLAVDGIWSPDSYHYRTSWAYKYPGSYGVALSILFNDFHQKTFEREMERQAPYMNMGAPLIDGTAPWWLKVLQSLLSNLPAVARPGRFPFDDRWQELHYPFVREDSHWKKFAEPENIQVDESATAPEGSSDLELRSMLDPKDYKMYIPCLDSDESSEGCFQMGNFYVRERSLSKKSDFPEEPVPTDGPELPTDESELPKNEPELPTTEPEQVALVEQGPA